MKRLIALASVLHSEESLFDAREYCHGFMFIVR